MDFYIHMEVIALIGSVYNHYLSTYGNKELTKSDVHKKSELRGVYNAIVKMNKNSPLYKVNSSKNLQKYAIDLKENALSLKSAAGVFDELSTENPSFKNKAVSSNETVAKAIYIGNPEDTPEDITLKIEKLATPQINEGSYLANQRVSLEDGKYSFDIGVGDFFYEFHTSIKEGDTNLGLQERIARLINNSKIGVIASVNNSIDGSSSLSLKSAKTGVNDFKPQVFTVSENDTENLSGLVEYLGIENTTTKASNSQFTINGIEKSSASNVLNLANQYEVSLLSADDDDEILISVQEDYESFIKDVEKLTDKYNEIVILTGINSEFSNQDISLNKELTDISKNHKNELESIGLTVADDGTLSINESLFTQSIREGSLSETLDTINNFKKDLVSKANAVSINPMLYVNKTMISYPHPVSPRTNPYITSIYSGMMYNNYV